MALSVKEMTEFLSHTCHHSDSDVKMINSTGGPANLQPTPPPQKNPKQKQKNPVV